MKILATITLLMRNTVSTKTVENIIPKKAPSKPAKIINLYPKKAPPHKEAKVIYMFI